MSETQQAVEQTQVEQQVQQPQEQPVQQMQEQPVQQAPVEQPIQQEQVQTQQQPQEEFTGWQIKSMNTDKEMYRANQTEFDYQQNEQYANTAQEQEVAQQATQNQQADSQSITNQEQVSLQEKLAQLNQEQPVEFDPFEKLGVKDDAYFQKLYQAYKNDALEEFLVATHTDYDAISDAELIRMQVENQYPTLQPDEKDLIFKMKLEKEFSITDLEDSDNRAGQLLMKLEAQKIRDGLKQEQAQYQVKPRVNDEFELFKQQMQAQQLESQKQLEVFHDYLKSTPEYKNFETNRIVQFGEGDNKINYEVSAKPDDFLKDSLDQDNFFAKFLKQDGALDLAKWQKVWAYANDPTTVERAIYNAGKSQGEKRLYDELHNARVENTTNTPPKSSGFVIKSIDGRRFG